MHENFITRNDICNYINKLEFDTLGIYLRIH